MNLSIQVQSGWLFRTRMPALQGNSSSLSLRQGKAHWHHERCRLEQVVVVGMSICQLKLVFIICLLPVRVPPISNLLQNAGNNFFVLNSRVGRFRMEVVRENKRVDRLVRASAAMAHLRQLHRKRARLFSAIEVASRVDKTNASANSPVPTDAQNWCFQSA